MSGGDPIGFWLTTPLLGFEPPAVVVRRYWRTIAAVAGDTLTVVAAHSGPMRALVAHAFARDLGEAGKPRGASPSTSKAAARTSASAAKPRRSPCRSSTSPHGGD